MSKRIRASGIFLLVVGSAFVVEHSAFPGGTDRGKPAASQQQVAQQTIKPVQPVTPINKTIRVIYPNGGESLIRGKTYVVRWQSTGMQTVKLDLIGSPSGYTMGTAPAAVSSWNWKVPHLPWGATYGVDVVPGAYTIKISDSSGNPSDSSDSSFQVVLPEVDLECRFAGVKREDLNIKTFKIQIRNNGTRVLNDVLFNWVIKKNGVMLSQDGAGYSQVYPNTIYECEISVERQSGRESWSIYAIDFYLDPQNRQGEEQDHRGDNQLSFNS